MKAFQGFKDFIMRGNVVDLAVAVVIGAAFSGVVKAFTDNIIQPLINSFGSAKSEGLRFYIRKGRDSTLVDFSALITALINFLIIAAVIYFLVVLPLNLLQERRKRGAEPEPAAPAEDILLLQQIRDLLAEQSQAVTPDPHGRHTDPPPAQ
jgi:large conductance mechanosensitive channel